jgi:hypothetical protein
MTKRLQFLNSNGLTHIFLFGLLSIILLGSLYLFNFANIGYTIKSSEKDVLWLLILFSYPHFIASYYWFYKNKILREENNFVGKYLPLIIVGLLVLVFSLKSQILIQPMLVAAWILLFWHFAKQSYGCSVFLAKQNFPQTSKSWLLYSYLSLAGFGFLNIQRSESKILLFKSYVSVYKVPEYFSQLLLGFAWILFLAFIANYLKQSENLSLKEKIKKIVIISIPWVSNLMWFSRWAVESFFILIPIFHALQYSPFILQGIARLQTETKSFYKVIVGVFLASALFFVGVPYALNHLWPQVAGGFVTSVFIFFNLHHFFIDSVGWKLSQESLRKILFS